MPRLVEKDYATCARPSSELGLHWCANPLGALGGSVRAHSGGLGRGIQFELRMPLRQSPAQAGQRGREPKRRAAAAGRL
jgi:hypothetical protein